MDPSPGAGSGTERGTGAAEPAGVRLLRRIRTAARAHAGQAAVMAPQGTLSYRDLLARGEALAGRLGRSAAPVLIYGHKEPGMLVGILASLRLGRAYAPVDASVPPARLAALLDVVRPGNVVALRDLPPAAGAALAAAGVAIERLGPLGEETDAGGPVPARRSAASAAPAAEPPGGGATYILSTSGTTGEPKGVPVPGEAIEHFLDWVLGEQGFRPGRETFLNQAPLHFDLSVLDVYGALLTGGTLWCVEAAEIADPRRLFARLSGAPLTVWVSTPSFAAFCLAEPRFGAGMLPSLRKFLFCGETLPPATVRELGRRFPEAEVWNLYGPTEATVAVTSVRLDPAALVDDRALPVGRAAPGMAVWVADPAEPLVPLPRGAEGEVVVAGPQVALGYVVAAHRPVPPGFSTLGDGRRAYRTGDRGRFGPDGLLYCGGRFDRQVKLHGYRIELEEVEARLRAVPGVGDAAVLVARRGGAGDHLVAFVVPAPGADLPAGDLALSRHLRRALGAHLADWALPRRAVRLSSPPLTASGKLDRTALQESLP